MNKRIRVLIIQGYAYQKGGTITFLHYLLSHLDKSKFEPTVLFLSQGELIKDFQSIGISVRVINSRRLLNVGRLTITIFRIIYLIYKLKIDIVFSNDGREHVYGGLAAYLTGTPATLFWHSFFSRRLLGKLALSVPVRAIFTNNKEKKRAIEKYLRLRGKVYYIQLGIEMPTRRGTIYRAPTIRHKLGFAPHIPVITQISHLIPWKGHTYFIKAIPKIISHFPQAKFLIVGSVPSHVPCQRFISYKDELKKLAKDLKLENSLTFLEYIKGRKAFLEIIQESDIIVHPAVYEDFGIIILESWAYSKPVIASNGGGPKEFMEDGVDGILVPPRDPDAIADAVLRLLEDEKLRKEIGKNGRKKVEKYFQADKMVKEIEKLVIESLGH